MSIRKSFALLFLTSLSSLLCQAQKAWTLTDCIDYAKEHNLQVQQSRNSLQSTEIDVKQSQAALFPALTFSTQHQLGFQKLESQSYGSYDSMAKNPSYGGSYTIQGNVTVYNGGTNWLTVKQNKLQQQVQELDLNKTEHSLEVNIIQAFYQVLYAHESVATNEEIVKLSEKELERTKALYQVGKGNKVNVAQMESQLQQNRYTLTQSVTTEADNILALKKLLQISPDAEFKVDYHQFSDEEVMALIPSLEESVQMAVAYLPDMKAADLKVKSQEMQIKMAKGAYKPTVSVNAGISTNNGNTLSGSVGKQLSNHLQGSLGMSVQVPILDHRSTKSSVEKAKVQLSNTMLDQENTLLELKNTIASLHLDILSAQSRYKSAVSSEEAARQSYEMMNERYAVGLETLIDLLTEKNNYIRAKQETLQGKYTALLNQKLLKCYIGEK